MFRGVKPNGLTIKILTLIEFKELAEGISE